MAEDVISDFSGEIVWKGKSDDGEDAYIVESRFAFKTPLGGTIPKCHYVAYTENATEIKWIPNAALNECELGMDEGGLFIRALEAQGGPDYLDWIIQANFRNSFSGFPSKRAD